MSYLGSLFTNYNLNPAGISFTNYALTFMLLKNQTEDGSSLVLG
jgi:hypothetical protein